MDRPPAALLTVSDGVAEGSREDVSGPAVADALDAAGFEGGRREGVPDARDRIERALRDLAAAGPRVVTTRGTGFGPRDVTPEATLAVIEREAPGLAEAMRAAGRAGTPMADLSRGVAGTIGGAPVLNLPGGPRGAVESLQAVLPILPHALELVAGRTLHRETPPPVPVEPRVVATAVRVHGDPPCRAGQRLVLGRSGPLEGTLGCAEFDGAAAADVSAV